MPVTNLVIVLFLLAMAYFGSVYGLFSAFMHLMTVIAVGAISFAVWEPLTLGLIIKYAPPMAWTLGLIVPFGVLLLVFRMVVDKLIPRDAQFMPIVSTLLGAACGATSGILTAGVAVIALGFMPFGADLGGFQPYSVGAGGVVQETGGKLWIPVHRMAASFYTGLSAGAFSTSTPMNEYMPDLDVQMSLLRARPDNVSIVASPDAVSVTGAFIAEAAALTDASPALGEALGPDFTRPGYRLVVVGTEWSKVEGTVDGDRKLRLPASHVRLVTKSTSTDDPSVNMLGPKGFTVSRGGVKEFYPFDSGGVQAEAPAPANFFWVFLVPEDQTPRFLMVRKLRLNLPELEAIITDPLEVLATVGAPPVPQAEAGDDGLAGDATGASGTGATVVDQNTGIDAGTYALDVEISTRLPQSISKNASSGLSYTTVGEEAFIETGSTGSSRKTAGNIGARSRVSAFNVPSHEAMVRVKIDFVKGNSLYAGGMSSAAALNEIFLKDIDGNAIHVSAWVWKKEDKTQDIHYDAFQTLRNAKQLPITRMNKGDEFYLYFTVTRPAVLVSYNIGGEAEQRFEPPLKIPLKGP
jgi:hypothetical protein